MIPTYEQILREAQARAYRSRRILVSPFDIQQARHNLLLRLNYASAVNINLSARPVSKPKWPNGPNCRYCLRTRPATKFSNSSHLIPEFLGNRHLLAFDECDNCNQSFSENLEGDLDRLTRPIRAFLGIKKKRKKGGRRSPKFESKGKATQLWRMTDPHRYVILDRADARIIERDEENKRYTFRLPAEPFSWIEVYRALAKIGFGILPPEELPRYDHVRQWIIQKKARVEGLTGVFAMGKIAATFREAMHPAVRLWHLKRSGMPCPRFVVELVLPHLAFVFPMPAIPGELARVGGEVLLPVPDLTEQPGWTFPDWAHFDMRDAGLEKGFVLTATMTYETDEPIDNDEFRAATGVSWPA